MVIGPVAGLVIVVTTGSVAQQVGTVLGIGSTATTVWGFVKWPVLLLIFVALLAVLYKAGPNVRLGGARWVSPGSALAAGIWLIASGLFAFVARDTRKLDDDTAEEAERTAATRERSRVRG